MAKQGYERGSRGDELKMPKFRDPITGKVVPQNPQGNAYAAGAGKVVDSGTDISKQLEAEQKRMANPSGRK